MVAFPSLHSPAQLSGTRAPEPRGLGWAACAALTTPSRASKAPTPTRPRNLLGAAQVRLVHSALGKEEMLHLRGDRAPETIMARRVERNVVDRAWRHNRSGAEKRASSIVGNGLA